jgi:hypothetical protein
LLGEDKEKDNFLLWFGLDGWHNVMESIQNVSIQTNVTKIYCYFQSMTDNKLLPCVIPLNVSYKQMYILAYKN